MAALVNNEAADLALVALLPEPPALRTEQLKGTGSSTCALYQPEQLIGLAASPIKLAQHTPAAHKPQFKANLMIWFSDNWKW